MEPPPPGPALPPDRPLPVASATTPMKPIRGQRHGNGGTRRPGAPHLGPVYTICLTVLILISFVALGSGDLPDTAKVLALVVGAGSAGILLGRNVNVTVNGHGLRVEHGERVGTSQQLPHEDDQRDQK